jgi:hypothetical protein
MARRSVEILGGVGTGLAEEVNIAAPGYAPWGLAVTALVLGLVLQDANGSLPGPTDESWVLIPLAIGFPVVGAAIAQQQPRHPIAWIFLGSGLAPDWPSSKGTPVTQPGDRR